MTTDVPDFAEVHDRFQQLSNGAQAELRRASELDALRDTPGLYRLFPGARPSDQQARLAFLLPWCPHLKMDKTFAALCADAVSEDRIMQIARASPPSDIVALRRLVIQLHPAVGWLDLARTAWFWGKTRKRPAKRQLVEDYYIALHRLDQGTEA